MDVRMELSRIFIREMTEMQIIELSEIDGDRTFPIVIGLPEAFAIERRLKGATVARPQTHDLLASVMLLLGGKLEKIVITDLIDGTFYAKLFINQDGELLELDSRPSDAIALGVAEGVPLFVNEGVLDQIEKDTTGNGSLDDDDEDSGDDDFEIDW